MLRGVHPLNIRRGATPAALGIVDATDRSRSRAWRGSTAGSPAGRTVGEFGGELCEGCDVIEVPAVVRNKAILAGATAWLAGLPALVGAISREWGLAVGRPFGDATEVYVAEAISVTAQRRC